jgi:tetratricopeptide (TPR) repeat protein
MIGLLKGRQKMFIGMICLMIYCMLEIPILNAIDVRAAEPATNSEEKSQSNSHPVITPFRTAQVNLEMFEKTAPSDEQTAKLSEKEKKKLVEQGVINYQEGEREKAKKTFEYAKVVFPENHTVPYYLGLIYLEEGKRSDAIAEWKHFVLMDPNSEESLEIHKYLTLLIREEAVENAKQAISNEDTLILGDVDDNTVVVTTFFNLGSENLELLGKGMAAMLIHDLSQVPDIEVVERVKLLAFLQEMDLGTSGLVDKKTAPKVGRLLKSKYVTTGSLTDSEKENLHIVSVVFDTEKTKIIDTQEAQGPLKKFYDLEKEIACKIIEDLGRDCSKVPAAFGKIHTRNLQALTLYSVGLNYFDQEKYDEARAQFQNAIDEDPAFDLAKEALVFTPTTAMRLMTPSQIILALSSSGTSSTVLGSASATTTDHGDDHGTGIGWGTTMAAAGAAVAVGIAVAAGGGGGGGDSSSTLPSTAPIGQPNLTGAWTGTWTDSSGNDNGSISLDLTQAQGSDSVGGSATITGTNCTMAGTVSGTISGNSFQANITGSGAASFTASFPTSTSMSGILEVTSGPCAVVSGHFSANITTGNATVSW